VVNNSITLTATVTANAPGAGIPTGTVTFKDGATTLGTGILNGAGQAAFSVSTLSNGNHAITVVYGGDANFTGSVSSNLIQMVSVAANSQSVITGENQPIGIALTATSISGGGSTFAIAARSVVGTVSLSGNLATYAPRLNFSGTDSFTFTATSNGNGNATSAPATVSILVTPPPLFQSTPVISPNPLLAGQIGTFTANATVVSGMAAIAWDFGDGTTTVGANVTHIYAQPGLYTVTVTATSPQGLTATTTETVFVAFTISGNTGALPPGSTGVILNASTGGPSGLGGGKIFVDYVKRDKTWVAGNLNSINFPPALTTTTLFGQSGNLTLGSGALAQTYVFTINKSGKGATGLPIMKIDLKKHRIQFKAQGPPGLTDLVESIGGAWQNSVKKGPLVTLPLQATLQIGNSVFLAMTFELQYHQTGNTGKGSTTGK